jgi:hypothetical protein
VPTRPDRDSRLRKSSVRNADRLVTRRETTRQDATPATQHDGHQTTPSARDTRPLKLGSANADAHGGCTRQRSPRVACHPEPAKDPMLSAEYSGSFVVPPQDDSLGTEVVGCTRPWEARLRACCQHVAAHTRISGLPGQCRCRGSTGGMSSPRMAPGQRRTPPSRVVARRRQRRSQARRCATRADLRPPYPA